MEEVFKVTQIKKFKPVNFCSNFSFMEGVFEIEENEEGKETLVLHSSIENEDQISKYENLISNRDKDIKKVHIYNIKH